MGALLGLDFVGQRSFNIRSQPTSIQEGQSHTAFVSLVNAPEEDLTVTISTNSSNITVGGAATQTLTFTSQNYAVEQSIQLAAAKGASVVDSSTAVTLTGSSTTVPYTFSVAVAQFGGLFQQVATEATGQEPFGGVIADFDGDTLPDIAVTNWTDDNISVLRNITSGGTIDFANRVNFGGISNSTPGAILATDMDGDGKVDIVITNYNTSALPSKVSIFCNTSTVGNLSFTRIEVNLSQPMSAPAHPWGLTVADFDGDTRKDIAVANLNFNNKNVDVLRNASGASCTALTFDAPVSLSHTIAQSQVAAGDLDGDGKPDLVSAPWGNSVLTVRRNTGTSGNISFDTAATVSSNLISNEEGDLHLADMDGDGKLDVVLNGLRILRNTSTVGSISFSSFQSHSMSLAHFRFALADIDGDSRLDAVVTYSYSFGGTLLRRNKSSTGSLSFLSTVNLNTVGTDILLGDLNGDNKPDLVLLKGPESDFPPVLTGTQDQVHIYQNMYPD